MGRVKALIAAVQKCVPVAQLPGIERQDRNQQQIGIEVIALGEELDQNSLRAAKAPMNPAVEEQIDQNQEESTQQPLPGFPLREKLQIEIAAKDQEDPGDSVIRVQKASQGPCKQQRSEAKQRLIPVTL